MLNIRSYLLGITVVLALGLLSACSSTTLTTPAPPATPSTPVAELATPDDAVFVTIALAIKPDQMDAFLEMMTAAAPDTRNWDGCRLFDIYVNPDKPGQVLFYEIWDSKEQQAAYVQWRTDTGFNDQLGPFLAGGVEFSYLNKVAY